jgi:hypothetical protein
MMPYGLPERPGWSRRASAPIYVPGAPWSPPVQLAELFPSDDSFVSGGLPGHTTTPSPLAPQFFMPPGKPMPSDGYWNNRDFPIDLPPIPPTPLSMVSQEGWEAYIPSY